MKQKHHAMERRKVEGLVVRDEDGAERYGNCEGRCLYSCAICREVTCIEHLTPFCSSDQLCDFVFHHGYMSHEEANV